MTELPAAARDQLGALLPPLLTEVRTVTTDAGTTRKTLWRLHDGALVESVLMQYPDRITVCISSQAGCGMACPFCATGQGGLTRNLSTAEIVDQVRAAARSARDDLGGRLSNVVFMGMGEPLANYRAVEQTLRRLTDTAARLRPVAPLDHGVDGGPRPGDHQADRGRPPRDAGRLAARAGRRAARHPRPDQHPLEGRRGAGRGGRIRARAAAGGTRSSTP